MSDQKKQIRPAIPSIKNNGQVSSEEKFQNNILRPIIKLQHDLIVRYFEHYLTSKKVKIEKLNELQKRDLIEISFNRDPRLKTDLRSLIIGLFTLEEYSDYLQISSPINKRINSIIKNRVSSIYMLKV
ncbi:MAG: hypothetical protein ACI9GM_000083 [Salibacteraceae bacterium]|jgi:hypothetical protein